MELGFIGLGRMGSNMVRRLLRAKHRVVAYNRSPDKIKELASEGAIAALSLKELVAQLTPPRAIWLMLPAGAPVTEHIDTLIPLLSKGDILIDGGNCMFKDSIARGEMLTAKGFHFLDVGVSGGVWGLQAGYCMMIGGEPEVAARLDPIFKTLAPPDGYLHCGPAGSGHYVKMVHNGIEYGMLQAYGEGFEMLKASRYPLDLQRIAHLWNQGSVVRSWLLELADLAFQENGNGLEHIKGYVEDSGEGRWTVQEAVDLNVPAPVLTLSLLARIRSRQEESYSAKVIAALRNQFGGHAVKAE